ncbi:MAG: ribose-5-phosphate isomerase RpiA [Streptococcaceae bacterium]|jgi:ribose 5-phosphate isomerase A|nr:ribose-5-phosphate isomerase RpiA [Streptococcaceae bacterium]
MDLKKMVGTLAASHVKSGMVVGLGTGTTANYMIEELGRRVQEEGLEIVGVTTSTQTQKLAEALEISLIPIDEVTHIDLTIDGADEIAADFSGIKGGGAALLFEKIVAAYSSEVIWIVDHTKLVQKLGKFPLPVEVIPFGSKQLFNKFLENEYNPTFRTTNDGKLLKTESGNYIIDLHLDRIENPKELADNLDKFVGVVEHGLFINLVSRVIVGYPDGPKTLEV